MRQMDDLRAEIARAEGVDSVMVNILQIGYIFDTWIDKLGPEDREATTPHERLTLFPSTFQIINQPGEGWATEAEGFVRILALPVDEKITTERQERRWHAKGNYRGDECDSHREPDQGVWSCQGD